MISCHHATLRRSSDSELFCAGSVTWSRWPQVLHGRSRLALAITSARLLVLCFDATAARMSRRRQGGIATRSLRALGTALAVALGATGPGGAGLVRPALGQTSALSQAQSAAAAA